MDRLDRIMDLLDVPLKITGIVAISITAVVFWIIAIGAPVVLVIYLLDSGVPWCG